MNHKSRNKLFNMTALALALSLAAPWAAFADNLVVDGDGLAPVAGNALNLGNINVGTAKVGTALLAIQRNGNYNASNVFKIGSPVTVSASVPITTNVATIFSDSGIVIPSNWSSASNNTMTGDTAFASITVSAAGATCGPKSATIEYIATGTGSDNAPLTRSTTLTVNWNVVNCQVSTSFSSVTASNSTYGGTTDLLAMVSPTGAAGSVNFYINGSSTAVAATYDPTTGRATVNNHVHGLNASATAYSVKAVFTAGPGFGDSEALSSSGLTVGKATPTVNVTGGTYTYDGAEHAASGSVVGVGNENLGTPSFTYNGSADAPVNAGSYTVVGSFAGNNNYAAASSSTSIEINRAEQVIEWSNPAAITYGTALSAAQLNASLTTGDGELSYSPAAGTFLDAGTRTLRADAAQTTNYNAAYAERQITVNKANPVITWNTPAAITYGTALNAAQLNASANVPGGFEYSVAANTVLSAGTHTLSVTFTPSDANNYNTATEQVQIVVNKANQVISWNTPAAITYGTTLSTVQLNASLTTGDGALTYSHNIGNMLNAGTHTLRVDAAGTDNYNPASKTVQLTVNKANATITVNGYSGVYDGSAHGATGSAKGVNNEDLSSLLNLGASFTNAPGGTASWTFNATSSDGNYNSTSGSVNIEINKAQAALTLGNLTHVWDGTAKAATATTSPAGLNVTFNYSNTSYNSATAPAAVGTYRVTATVNEQNYEGSTTGTLTISAWTFKGFYQPVDMSGVVNTVKAGSTVPMKWEVFKGSVEAKDVASIASTTYKAIACSTLTASEDAIEETTTSTAGLRFDTTGDQFIYNWKTPSTAGACYLFTMKTQDGSVLQANFKLK